MELQKEEVNFFKKPTRPVSLKKSVENSILNLLFLSLAFSIWLSVGFDFVDLLFNQSIGITGKLFFGTCYAGLSIWNASITFRALSRLTNSTSSLYRAIWKK
ncbi:hypothetical protein K6L09_20900 [Burkholderia cepacia]